MLSNPVGVEEAVVVGEEVLRADSAVVEVQSLALLQAIQARDSAGTAQVTGLE